MAVVSQGNDGFRGKKGNYSGENGKREKTLTESETGKKSKKQSNGGREREDDDGEDVGILVVVVPPLVVVVIKFWGKNGTRVKFLVT